MRWVLFRLSPEQWKEEERWHALFEEHVGHHWCFHHEPRPPEPASAPDSRRFYEPYAGRAPRSLDAARSLRMGRRDALALTRQSWRDDEAKALVGRSARRRGRRSDPCAGARRDRVSSSTVAPGVVVRSRTCVAVLECGGAPALRAAASETSASAVNARKRCCPLREIDEHDRRERRRMGRPTRARAPDARTSLRSPAGTARARGGTSSATFVVVSGSVPDHACADR